MGFLINPYNFAAGTVGGWVELGRTTLGSANADITVSSLANKRYLMVLMDHGRTGTGGGGTNLNGDTTSKYAFTYSINGGAESTGAPDTRIFNQGNGSNVWRDFMVSYMANYSTKEKLVIEHLVENQNGAANAPDRFETFGKHAQTLNPISSVQQTTNTTYTTGSEIVVLGWDPADTHTNNFWTELDSVNASGSPSTLNTNTFTGKKYLWIQIYVKNNNGANYADWRIRFNGDTGNNYATRQSYNGGSDTTYTSATPINYFGSYLESTGSTLMNMFIINNSSKEKLAIIHTSGFSNAQSGAGFAPNRQEAVIKWANISSQITSMQIYRDGGLGTFGNESIIKVWGSD